MSIPFSLLAKAIGGVAAVATPVTLSVVYRDNITELFIPKQNSSNPQNNNVEGTWTIESKDSENKVEVTYPKSQKCSITISKADNVSETDLINKAKEKLTEKLGTTNPNETNRKYRRGFIKKCNSSQSNNSLSLDVKSADNIDISSLFTLDDQNLNTTEQGLKDKSFSLSTSTEQNKITVTVTFEANSGSENSISVKTCKIIGSKKSSESTDIEANNLDSSKSDIESSITTTINGNKSGFLSKCKKSFNEEIGLELQTKNGETNKYELENISSITQ